MKIKPVMKDDELAVIGDILAERSSNPEAVKRQLLWLKYPEAFDAIVSNSPIIAYSRFCNGCQVEIGLSEIDDTYGCHQADCKYVEAVFKLNVENLMEEVINNAWSAACEIEYGGMLVSPPEITSFTRIVIDILLVIDRRHRHIRIMQPTGQSMNKLEFAVKIFAPRCKTLVDMATAIKPYLGHGVSIDSGAANKYLDQVGKSVLVTARELLLDPNRYGEGSRRDCRIHWAKESFGGTANSCGIDWWFGVARHM